MVINLHRTSITILVVFLAFFGVTQVMAQPVSLTVRYEDKGVYVPGSEILVKLTITNDSARTYRFKLAENRMFNVDFDVRTLSNLPLQPAPQFTRERTSNQQLYYRDVALEPGEEFSFTEDLSDFVAIEDSGVYIVRVLFYPELVGSTESPIVARNALSLTIQPPLEEEELLQAQIDSLTGEILEREAIPPDEAVAYMIDALQQQAWNRYFLYLDTEGLLLSDPQRERSYRQLSETEQRRQVASYEQELQESLTDPALGAIPTRYELVRTTYDSTDATVVMDLRFDQPGYTEVKRYTYFLRREDSVWYIYDYAVVNLGTE